MQRSIGQTLRTAREARGLSLLDASHRTRIPANRLQQLEDDNFAAFGNMAYAKSFLKNYSRYLEVDASEVANGFPVPVLGGPSDYRYLTETYGPWIERLKRPYRRDHLARSGHSPIPTLVGMFVVFVIAGVLLGNHLVARQKSDGKTEVNADSKVTGAPHPPSVSVAADNDVKAADKSVPKTPDVRTNEPETQPEMMIRPAVLPKNIPAPDSPTTPVRRPEIVN